MNRRRSLVNDIRLIQAGKAHTLLQPKPVKHCLTPADIERGAINIVRYDSYDGTNVDAGAIYAGPLYYKTDYYMRNGQRVLSHQGGTRSSKTYSVLQYLIVEAYNRPLRIDIIRATVPELKGSVIPDFKDIMVRLGLWDDNNYNITERVYRLGASVISFLSADDQNKMRGRKRDIAYINEANGVSLDFFEQIMFRTGQCIIDYNPSFSHSYIYTDVNTRPDCKVIKSSFLDNPFCPAATLEELELLKVNNPEAYKVWALGERQNAKGLIYTHWQRYDEQPKGYVAYGIDFGFNAPTAVVKVTVKDNCYYAEEVLYKTGLTNTELIAELKKMGISNTDYMFCDSAEPDRIQEFWNAGYNAQKATKDVLHGIGLIQSRKFYARGENLINELERYKWAEDKDGKPLDEPVKLNDHAMDAMRYAVAGIVKLQLA